MSANRNDPCPCGSGRKYKKCCMEADAQRQRAPFRLKAGFSHEPPTFSTDLDDLSNSVIGLIDSGELDAAEAACRRLQMQYPDQVDGIWRLAMVHEARGDPASAAKYYREAAAFMQTNEGIDEEGIADMLEAAKLMEARE
jgi:hypothetical protein